MKRKIKNKKILFTLLFCLSAVFPLAVKADGFIFILWGAVWYRSGGSLLMGDSNSVNSKAIATGYRTNISTNYHVSDTPDYDQIFAADGTETPAYFQWDIGSSGWVPTPSAGDGAVVVAETFNGKNGWTGDSWVGGIKKTITSADLLGSEAVFGNTVGIVMEPVPTPTIGSASDTEVNLSWTGLWDNSTGASDGTAHNTVTGYGVYRSDNGGAFQKLAATATQNAGGTVSYSDTTVTSGHTYKYKLSVLFVWTANTPNYFESTAKGPESASVSASTEPDRVVFSSSATSATAGIKSSVITIESRNFSGNISPVDGDTTVSLSSNSTGANKKFYSVSSGSCTTTEISSVVITSGTSSAQFCYYDEKTSSSTWTMTAHKSDPATPDWTDGTQTITITPAAIGSFSLSLASPQRNRKAFTGTDTLTALDLFGNVKTNFQASLNNVTFTASPSDGTITGFSGTNKLNQDSDFSNGVANLANKMIFSGTAGNHTFTVTSGDGKTADSGTVSILGGDISSFDFSLNSPQSMDTAFSGTNTLTAKDIDGNIITDFDASANNVTVTESASAGTVSGLGSGGNNVLNQAGDFSNGVCSLTGKMTYGGLAGNRTFKAVSGSASSTSNSVSFGPGAFAKFGLSLSSPQQNDKSFTAAAISAQDLYGNIVPSYDASATGNAVTITASNGGVMTISGGSAVLNQAGDFVSGTADLSGKLKYTGTMGSRTITAANADGKTGNATITITAGDAVSIKITNGSGSSATEVGDTTMNIDSPLALWAAGYDTSGNFAGNSTSGHWTVTDFDASDANAQINVSGVTNISFAPHKAPQSGIINFDSGTGMTDSTGTITVEAGAAHEFVIAAPSTAQVGVGFTSVQITANDKYGNLSAEYSGSKTLSLTGPGNGPESGSPTSSVSATFSSGKATSTSNITLVKAETTKITLTEGSASGQSNDIEVSAGNPTHLHALSPTPVTAGTSFNLTSITAQDTYGNVAKTYSGAKTISYSGPATGPLGNTPTYTTSVSFTDGVSTTALATTLYARETVAIHVDDGTLSGNSNSITVNASGTAASIEYVSGNNQTAPVSSTLAAPLVVAVKDNYGNLKNGYTVSFAVTKGGGSVNNSSVTTDTNGRAQTSWTIGSVTGIGINEAEARASGLSGSPVIFTAEGNPLAATLLDITAPSEVTAGTPFNITIKAIDSYGNVVTSYTGTKTVSYSGPHSSPDSTAPSYTTSVEFASGTDETVSTTLYKAETVTLTATIDGLTGDSLPITVNPASASEFSVLAPSTATVNLPFIISSLRALDTYGNVDTSYSGTKDLDYSGPGNSESGTPPSYMESVKFENGVATTQLDTTLVKAETAQITATDGSISGTSNTITVIYAEPYVLVYVSGNNQTGTPGSVLDDPLVAKVMDKDGNPANGKMVTFVPASSSGSVNPTSVTVGADGLASVDWTLGSSGNIQMVTASVPGISSTVLYVANGGSGGSTSNRLAFTTATQEISKNISSGTITICLQDVLGNNIVATDGLSVSLSTNSSTGKFALSANGTWDKTSVSIASGGSCANFFYQDSTSGLITLTASATDVLSASQSIYVETEISASTTDDDDDEGDTIIKKKKIINTTNYYTFIINNYYSEGTSEEVTIKASAVPAILSPRDSSLVMETTEGVTVSGTAAPDQTVVVMDGDKTVGSATSDRKGNWKTTISADKLNGNQASLTARTYNSDLKSSATTFQIKDGTNWMKKIMELFKD